MSAVLRLVIDANPATWLGPGLFSLAMGLCAGAQSAQAQSLRIAGPEFLVNAQTPRSQDEPAAVADPEGSFLVVWHGAKQSTPQESERRVWLRRASAGSPLGSEFQVNSTTGLSGSGLADIAINAEGLFVVVWENDYLVDGSHEGVFGQCYNPDLSPLGTEF